MWLSISMYSEKYTGQEKENKKLLRGSFYVGITKLSAREDVKCTGT